MKQKTLLAISIAATLTSTTLHAGTGAALPEGAVLSIEAGSNFNMGGPPTSLLGHKGLYVGPGFGNIGSLSHGGAPAVGDVGSVTQPWLFFCNTGYDYMDSTRPDFGGETGTGGFGDGFGVDMSGWTVTWNGIPAIPMGDCALGDPANNGGFSGCDVDADGVDDLVNTPIAVFTWDGTDGGTYTISHQANVPVGDPSGFGGVLYTLVLTGTVDLSPPADVAPVAGDDAFLVAENSLGVSLGITDNDSDSQPNDAIDKSSVDLDPGTAGQQVMFTTPLGGTVMTDGFSVTFDVGTTGEDSFSYTINDFNGNPSNVANVTLTVGNLAPVCNDDGIAEGAFIEVNINPDVTIDIIANDTDPNPGDGFDFATLDLDPATIGFQSIFNTVNGFVVDNGNGTVTYAPNPGFTGPTDSFSYNIMDDNSAPLACADATVIIVFLNAGAPVGSAANAFMILNSGSVGSDNKVQPALGDGSWFSMELSPGSKTHTPISGFNHITLGTTQPALSPNQPNIDEPWIFFGNLGVHQTTSDMLQLSNSNGVATLDFSGWDVSWNGIPSVPLGSGLDNGVATLNCYEDLVAGTPGVGLQSCDAGDEFVLTYRATVPTGDVSGFGYVKYALHLEGTISSWPIFLGCDETAIWDVTTAIAIGDCTTKTIMTMLPGTTSNAMGNSSGLYLAAADLGSIDPLLNPEDGQQCIGGCLDFVINNVPAGGHVNLVVKLTEAMPEGAVYRKLINGVWRDFDTSGGDAIGSAVTNAVTGNCQNPAGKFQTGLRAGNRCLFIRITDGGPNDADGLVNGTIVDPSGVALAGSPVTAVEATPTKKSGGSSGGTLYLYTLLTFIALLLIRKQYEISRKKAHN